MPTECSCGEPVSIDFHRVFEIDGEVRSCPSCTPKMTRRTLTADEV